MPGAADPDLAAWRLALPADRADADARGLAADFAAGWFALCASADLPAGAVLGVRRFGQKLVAWRGEDGVARALPARCPHAFVDMSLGGKVHGDWLECPFHSWRWDEKGALRDIPHSVKPIRQKAADCGPRWPLREADGMILIWHHAERNEPGWEPAILSPRDADPAAVAVREWEVASDLRSVAALGAAGAHVEAAGIVRRVVAPLPLDPADGPVDGSIEAVAHGAGQGSIRHSAAPGAALLVTAAPVERDRTLLRLALVAAGGAAADGIVLLDAVAAAIDRAKAELDLADAHGDAAIDGWFAQFRTPSALPDALDAYPRRRT